MVAGLALMGTGSAWADSCLQTIKDKGVITSGNGVMGSNPHVWQNPDGSYTGFEWELYNELAKRLGVKPDYIVTEWSTLIPGLKVGRWDIIFSSMSVTQEREQGAGILFTRPYFMVHDYIIVLEDSPITSVEDLRDKKVGTQLGTMDSLNAHKWKDEGKIGEVLDFNTTTEPFAALQNGQVDAVFLDNATFTGQQSNLKNLRIVGEPIYFTPRPEWAEAESKAPYILGVNAVGVRAECKDLADAISETFASMEADGTRRTILEKYGLWSPMQEKLMK